MPLIHCKSFPQHRQLMSSPYSFEPRGSGLHGTPWVRRTRRLPGESTARMPSTRRFVQSAGKLIVSFELPAPTNPDISASLLCVSGRRVLDSGEPSLLLISCWFNRTLIVSVVTQTLHASAYIRAPLSARKPAVPCASDLTNLPPLVSRRARGWTAIHEQDG